MTAPLPEIVMYARERFCPDVTRARTRLEHHGIKWTEYDVEADPQKRDEMQTLSGRPNVPTVLIGNAVLVEPGEAEIDQALIEAGFDLDDN